MPKLSRPRLPTLQNEQPTIVAGDGEGLRFLLAPVNDPEMVARIGEERIASLPGSPVTRTKGAAFRGPSGTKVTGERYLLVEGGRTIAALNVTHSTKDGSVVSNIYVAPEHRRKGLATTLIRAACDDHRKLSVDTSLTTAGAHFFGYPLPLANDVDEFLVGSKVVGADGQPIPVYHGTKASFGVFRTPAWFTPDYDMADSFSAEFGDGERTVDSKVMTVHLQIRNPLLTDDWHVTENLAYKPKWVAQQKKRGYDGVIFTSEEGEVEYIVFDPCQIRFAAAAAPSLSSAPSSNTPVARDADQRAEAARQAQALIEDVTMLATLGPKKSPSGMRVAAG